MVSHDWGGGVVTNCGTVMKADLLDGIAKAERLRQAELAVLEAAGKADTRLSRVAYASSCGHVYLAGEGWNDTQEFRRELREAVRAYKAEKERA